MHVARGVSHIWTAVIIAGLAVVLTGAVAYSSANAASQQQDDLRTAKSTGLLLDEMRRMSDRLDALEEEVRTVGLQAKSEPATLKAVFPEGAR